MTRSGHAALALLLAATPLCAVLAAEAGSAPTLASLETPSAELAVLVDAAPLRADRGEAIRRYHRLLDQEGVPQPLRTQATERLATLELERGLERVASGDDRGRLDLEAAVARFDGLLVTARPALRPDMHYQLARALDTLGHTHAAAAELDALVAEAPAHAHAAEAHFRRGEYRFVHGDYEGAERAYADVLDAPGADRFAEPALYRLGWTRYRRHEPEAAVEAFVALLDHRFVHTPPEDEDGDDPPGAASGIDPDLDALSGGERALFEDALRAAALALAQQEGSRTLAAVAAAHPQAPWLHLLHTALGGLFESQERWRDAALAYSAFARARPLHARAPVFDQAVIDVYDHAGFSGPMLEAKAAFAERYDLDGPFWGERTPAEHPEVTERLRTHVVELAGHEHALAQRDDEDAAAAAERAVHWYQRFLAQFPEDPGAGEHALLLGDLFTDLARHGEATAAYRAAAYDHGEHPRAAEAGFASILAARAHLETLAGDDARAQAAAMEFGALRFAERFPGHAQAVPVLVNLAEGLYAQGRQEEAIAVAQRVVARGPEGEGPGAGTAVAAALRVAGTVIANGHFELERYAEAEVAYDRLRATALPAALAAAIDVRVAAAIHRQGEAARAAGDAVAAVGHFVRLAETMPASAEAANALFDAGALSFETGAWADAAALLDRFARAYPDHGRVTDALRLRAQALKDGGRIAEAAVAHEGLAGLPDLDDSLRRAALLEAVALYREDGDAGAETRLLERVAADARFPDEVLEAQWRLAALAADAADPEGRAARLRAIVTTEAALGDASTARARWLAATARLELAAPLRDAFAAVPLTIPLEDSLARKRAAMEEALAAYGEASAYGVAEVLTAATHETGDLYYRLARDLLASERPPELAADALEQYEILLEEQVWPFEERALELFAANAARTTEGLYDPWIVASFERLATLAPARWHREEKGADLVIALHR